MLHMPWVICRYDLIGAQASGTAFEHKHELNIVFIVVLHGGAQNSPVGGLQLSHEAEIGYKHAGDQRLTIRFIQYAQLG